ncbi:MAG: helix-turn-helix domain-containing protein [Cellulosilyticum sp.]|nr:helix-turn-helix domain-containing protein [Cellulosilyticum sp.]
MNKVLANISCFNFNKINSDFNGYRDITGNKEEHIKFHNSSSMRIWYNDLSTHFETHWHNALEIIVPIENYYESEIENERFHIMPSEILFIPPGKLHSLTPPPSGKRFIFLFDISHLAELNSFSNIQSLVTKPIHVTQSTYPNIYDDIFELLFQILNEYINKNEFFELTIYSLLINIFVKFGYNHIHTKNLFPNVRLNKQKEYVQKFNNLLSYINTHYTEDLKLEDIAASAGFSKYHFSRLFKQYTDFTFYEYLCYRRIKAAEELLIQPDLSITEIALQSGFSSLSAFNRLFKQQRHCTPSEYRTKNHTIQFKSI